jgi:hypothetical protein
MSGILDLDGVYSARYCITKTRPVEVKEERSSEGLV